MACCLKLPGSSRRRRPHRTRIADDEALADDDEEREGDHDAPLPAAYEMTTMEQEAPPSYESAVLARVPQDVFPFDTPPFISTRYLDAPPYPHEGAHSSPRRRRRRLRPRAVEESAGAETDGAERFSMTSEQQQRRRRSGRRSAQARREKLLELKNGDLCRILSDYAAARPEEMSLKAGDIVYIVDASKIPEELLYGRTFTGDQGWFPLNEALLRPIKQLKKTRRSPQAESASSDAAMTATGSDAIPSGSASPIPGRADAANPESRVAQGAGVSDDEEDEEDESEGEPEPEPGSEEGRVPQAASPSHASDIVTD